VLFVTAPGAAPRTFLQIIQEKNAAQGKTAATRADLRFDANASGQIFVLNKADATLAIVDPANQGSIRVLEKIGMRFEKVIKLSQDDIELHLFACDLSAG
jgi:RimJ/RimL family protein N-acetyltransferase